MPLVYLLGTNGFSRLARRTPFIGYCQVDESSPNVLGLEDAPSTISCGRIGLEALNLTIPLPSVDIAISERTLARRKSEARLRRDESDRVYRLARIVARTIDILGSRDKASRWLRKKNRALADQAPLELLDTDAGTRQVEAVLGRIEHGVVS